MGLVTLDLPVVGQPNTTEDVKIRNNFTTLQNTINGNIDGSNLSPGILSQLGNFKSALSAIQVQDVGNANQIRAGRVLTPADFTNMGLSAPLGLWNLGTINDSSGNVRNLVNKGAVTFDTGITGAVAEASVFIGATTQAHYIADTGANDPFRIRTGSWGCWLKTAKRGTTQYIFSKIISTGATTDLWFGLYVNSANVPGVTAGSAAAASNISDVCDDRWHFIVGTNDGTRIRLYVDGALENSAIAGAVVAGTAASPLNVGGYGADATTATVSPFFGKVDEAFVTGDILSPEQVYNLYCASIPHSLGAVPTGTRLAVRRRKRAGTLLTTSFPATPARLYNFVAGSLNDEGTNATPLTSNPGTGSIVTVANPSGVAAGAFSFAGAHTGLSATDAGLPSGTSGRSYGCWFKSTATGGSAQGLVGWGTISTADAGLRIAVTTFGIQSVSGADAIAGPTANDGLWHSAVVTEDNAAVDGVKRRLYLDGRLVASSTVLTSLTLAGAGRFRIGAAPDGTLPFTGQIDGVFVYAGVLTPEQVKTLYNVGTQQLAPTPKADADHIEALELTRVLAHFDAVEGTDLIDLAVIA